MLIQTRLIHLHKTDRKDRDGGGGDKKKILTKRTFDIYVSTFELNELKSWDESFSTELYRPVLIKDLSLS